MSIWIFLFKAAVVFTFVYGIVNRVCDCFESCSMNKTIVSMKDFEKFYKAIGKDISRVNGGDFNKDLKEFGKDLGDISKESRDISKEFKAGPDEK